jgi:hypothetical protein
MLVSEAITMELTKFPKDSKTFPSILTFSIDWELVDPILRPGLQMNSKISQA